jgi:prepilin-type N-terminal cleavage/methylation domain-containing protein
MHEGVRVFTDALSSRRSVGGESGFTLVELLVVIAILGILAGIAVFSVAGIANNGQASACATEKSTIITAEEAYFGKTNSYGTLANLTSGTNAFLATTPTWYVPQVAAPHWVVNAAGTAAGCS